MGLGAKNSAVGVLLLTYLAPAPCEAQSSAGRRDLPLTVLETSQPIRVDGVLDDSAWTTAAPVPLSWEVAPGNNTAARVATDCRVAFDAAHFYFGCMARDPRPREIRAYLTDRDRTQGHDRIQLMLDPFDDARRGFQFSVTPLGVQDDAMYDQVADSLDATWDAIWRSAGSITDSGYTVEVAIPFKSLRFPPADRARSWGFYFRRSWPRSVDAEFSSIQVDRSNNCILCQSQHFAGLTGLSPGLNLEVVPTVTSQRTDRRTDLQDPGLDGGALHSEAGLDGRWGPTAGLSLNLTLNPDFSQVEADDPQLDVNNRFALFFPERRPFFLEAADLFNTPVQAVFTRSIAEPAWGAKLSGKLGSSAIGAIVTRDEVNQLLIPGEESSTSTTVPSGVTGVIGRLRRDLGRASTIGSLVTLREGDGYHNRVAGVDGALRPHPTLTLEAQYLRSHTDYPDAVSQDLALPRGGFGGGAFHGLAEYATENWLFRLQRTVLDQGFRSDAGFTNQVGTGYTLWKGQRLFHGGPADWYTKIELSGGFEGTDGSDGRLIYDSRWLFARYDGPLRSILALELDWDRERAGNHVLRTPLVRTFAGLSPSGNLTFGLGYWTGRGVDVANQRRGQRTRWRPTTTLRFGRHLEIVGEHTLERLEVPEGLVFRANLTSLRTLYSFNPRTFVRAVFQYRHTKRDPEVHQASVDRVSENLLSQLLFSYKVNPQTVLFLGYADNRRGTVDEERNQWPLTQMDRTVFAKVGYAWRP